MSFCWHDFFLLVTLYFRYQMFFKSKLLLSEIEIRNNRIEIKLSKEKFFMIIKINMSTHIGSSFDNFVLRT